MTRIRLFIQRDLFHSHRKILRNGRIGSEILAAAFQVPSLSLHCIKPILFDYVPVDVTVAQTSVATTSPVRPSRFRAWFRWHFRRNIGTLGDAMRSPESFLISC